MVGFVENENDQGKRRFQPKRILKALWHAGLMILWGICWGGLSFYAIVVVPVGTEILGSVEQGFVTQQVTWWHNWLLIALSVCLMVEALIQRNRFLGAAALGLGVIAGLLVFHHAYLSRIMDFENHLVPNCFYSQHAIYLWITATEWFIGIFVPFLLRYKDDSAETTTS